MDTWKEFEASEISHSASHHLAAIAQLTEEQGYARAVDVSRRLHITRGSVSLALKSLKARGLVREDDNRFLSLSDEGQEIVDRIRARRKVVRGFFEDVLGMEHDQAETDACKIEHLLSDEACRRIERFARNQGRSKRRRRTPVRS